MGSGTGPFFTLFLYRPLYKWLLDIPKLLILLCLAPRHGFEPRFTAPKAAVLPLDDRGVCAFLQDGAIAQELLHFTIPARGLGFPTLLLATQLPDDAFERLDQVRFFCKLRHPANEFEMLDHRRRLSRTTKLPLRFSVATRD
jgi:hypothetical protein